MAGKIREDIFLKAMRSYSFGALISCARIMTACNFQMIEVLMPRQHGIYYYCEAGAIIGFFLILEAHTVVNTSNEYSGVPLKYGAIIDGLDRCDYQMRLTLLRFRLIHDNYSYAGDATPAKLHTAASRSSFLYFM